MVSIFVSLLLLIALPSGAAELPVYKIDLDFLKTKSVLSKGTSAETNAYNRDIGNPKNYPSNVREAILDFGDHQARVFLIASKHDGPPDNVFIRKALSDLQLDPQTSRLFIEQGDPYAIEGGSRQVERLIETRIPELTSALARARVRKTSILNPDFSEKMVFAVAAREWRNQGGQVFNFDAASNYSSGAVAFLAANLGEASAIRFLREGLQGESFTAPEFKILLNKGYGSLFARSTIDEFQDCCGNLRSWVVWIVDDNQLRNLVRERFMRLQLATLLKDGDVILTHPAHVEHLLSPEALPAGSR